MKQSQITYWCHTILRSQIKPEGIYVDATMGNGKDTLFLCRLAGTEGHVWAFDIQTQALETTKALLSENDCIQRATLILDGHENMDRYLSSETADAICFNFGYLPGGNHSIATRWDTSLKAVQKGLDILKPGGMMSLCIYSGGDTGFEEREFILKFLKELPADKYTVILNEYYNRGNHPPLPVFVFK
nr:class I SAM-dependent methyltransferase [uncultured Mediterraneibacter sp.]